MESEILNIPSKALNIPSRKIDRGPILGEFIGYIGCQYFATTHLIEALLTKKFQPQTAYKEKHT